jgi:hypothetical protein
LLQAEIDGLLRKQHLAFQNTFGCAPPSWDDSFGTARSHKYHSEKLKRNPDLKRLEEVFAGGVFLAFVDDGVWGEICEAVIRVMFVVKEDTSSSCRLGRGPSSGDFRGENRGPRI